MKQIVVHPLPECVSPQEFAGATVAVIDLLRATSTICTALAAGAIEVVPKLEIAETLQLAEQLGRQFVVLGGERHGKLIPGFDLGNSPLEYTPERVARKRLLFTTTNGTKALAHTTHAARAVCGSFLNLSAVVRAIRADRQVHILCAGTDGEETEEDLLAAGAIVSGLTSSDSKEWELSISATTARDMWEELVKRLQAEGTDLSQGVARELRSSRGGKNLLEIGNAADLMACAQIDRFHVVPHYEPFTGRIVLP